MALTCELHLLRLLPAGDAAELAKGTLAKLGRGVSSALSAISPLPPQDAPRRSPPPEQPPFGRPPWVGGRGGGGLAPGGGLLGSMLGRIASSVLGGAMEQLAQQQAQVPRPKPAVQAPCSLVELHDYSQYVAPVTGGSLAAGGGITGQPARPHRTVQYLPVQWIRCSGSRRRSSGHAASHMLVLLAAPCPVLEARQWASQALHDTVLLLNA